MSLLLFLLTPAAMAARHTRQPVETNPDPHAEDVTLRFGWPAGMTCDVAFLSRRTSPGVVDRTMTGTVHLDVSAHAEGLLVHPTVTALQATGGAPTTDAAATALLARVAATQPDMILTPDGQFRRLENLAAYHSSIETALQPLLTRTDPATAEAARAMLARLTDVVPLQASASAAWRRSVGFWPGLTLIPGAHVSSVGEGEAPLLPGSSLTWNHTALLVGPAACDATDMTKRCVQLEDAGTPSTKALTAALEHSGAALLTPGATGVSWSNVQMSMRSVLVAEPGTLVPHSEVVELSVHAEARWGSDKRQVIDLVETRSETSVCLVPAR